MHVRGCQVLGPIREKTETTLSDRDRDCDRTRNDDHVALSERREASRRITCRYGQVVRDLGTDYDGLEVESFHSTSKGIIGE